MKWKLGDAKCREAERHDAEKCETERRKMEHCEAELYDAERRKMKDLMQTNDLTKMPCLLNSSLYQLYVSTFKSSKFPSSMPGTTMKHVILECLSLTNHSCRCLSNISILNMMTLTIGSQTSRRIFKILRLIQK